MQTTNRWGWGVLLLCLALLVNGCGYSFPHVYEGAHRTVYMPTWQNRTNKLGLDMKLYQSLSRWFQQAEKVDLTRQKGEASDYVLTGEILSIDLPSVSWNTIADVTGTKVSLIVRFALKDQRSGKAVWEVGGKLYTADYTVTSTTVADEDQALAKIIDDLSEDLYIGVLKKIRQQQNRSTPPSS